MRRTCYGRRSFLSAVFGVAILSNFGCGPDTHGPDARRPSFLPFFDVAIPISGFRPRYAWPVSSAPRNSVVFRRCRISIFGCRNKYAWAATYPRPKFRVFDVAIFFIRGCRPKYAWPVTDPIPQFCSFRVAVFSIFGCIPKYAWPFSWLQKILLRKTPCCSHTLRYAPYFLRMPSSISAVF